MFLRVSFDVCVSYTGNEKTALELASKLMQVIAGDDRRVDCFVFRGVEGG